MEILEIRRSKDWKEPYDILYLQIIRDAYRNSHPPMGSGSRAALQIFTVMKKSWPQLNFLFLNRDFIKEKPSGCDRGSRSTI